MAHKRIEVSCPYCGFTNAHRVEIGDSGFVADHMVTCDLEEGGCDVPFVVTARVRIDAQAVKIDWDRDEYPQIDEQEIGGSAP